VKLIICGKNSLGLSEEEWKTKRELRIALGHVGTPWDSFI
jgi:hypothetical protein